MPDISTILFDVGGVLLSNGWDHAERMVVLSHFSIDRTSYEQRHESANDAWERGFITAEQFLTQTIFFEPRSFTPAEFLEDMKAQQQVLAEGAMRILGELRASRKIKLAMLNNESRELNDYRIEHFQLDEFFDEFFSSCYLGLRKPEPNIFRLALDVLQREAAEVFFIDDRQENCDAAMSLGIHAVLYRNPTQLEQDLAHLGVRST
ncbi:MAG: HAD family hydrolase [Acidobacteriaceae bacterium]